MLSFAQLTKHDFSSFPLATQNDIYCMRGGREANEGGKPKGTKLLGKRQQTSDFCLKKRARKKKKKKKP